MNPNIPAGAAKLLDLIGSVEAPRGYNTVYGNNQNKLTKPLTSMKLREVIDSGLAWSSSFGSSAAGRYQFITGTLKRLRSSEGLSGNEVFQGDLQDSLGFALLEGRGYENFVTGKLSVTGFGLALAKEWASFPVLQKTQGAHRKVERGETYYAGDKLNKALVAPGDVETLLKDIRSGAVAQFALVDYSVALSDRSLQYNDDETIQSLIELGSTSESIARIHDIARRAMKDAGYGSTLHNACAATLSAFLREAGIPVPMTLGAGRLASRLKKDRGWEKIAVGRQEAGDVGVTFDRTSPAGADHIYLVIERKDEDRMIIADNQSPSPHSRAASGKGKTQTEYFLRAPGASGTSMSSGEADGSSGYPAQDEDTNSLREPSEDSEVRPARQRIRPILKRARDDTPLASKVHLLRPGVCCETEERGFETPNNLSPLDIVVNASEGFVPLWSRGVTLRWQFRESSFASFDNADALKERIEELLAASILAWGDAAPVKFTKRTDASDFEILMQAADSCTLNSCVLASAFFPDPGRHKLRIYPKMFEQDEQEQIDTLTHEIGHMFGLRHFFAKVSEEAWPAEIFGTHNKFSIMNYGQDSKLTDADRSDLKKLYSLAWSGEITAVNGTPIKFVKPFHASGVTALSAERSIATTSAALDALFRSYADAQPQRIQAVGGAA